MVAWLGAERQKRRLGPALAGGALLAAGGLAFGLGTLVVPLPPSAEAAPRATCQNSAASLGVARVVEVDTSAGPHFGHQQYHDLNFLAPGEIVLTFDDGPLRPMTQPVVDALEAQCTKATFFMVGSQALADPDMVKQIIRKGHTVGTHTFSHANLRKSTPLKARQEIELGFSAVAAAAGQPIAPFFRFPFLADTKAMLGYTQTRQLGIFSIEIDSLDYKSKSAPAVHHEILAQLAAAGKGILLFHDIQPATAHALPGLLDALREKGYKVVHLKPKAMVTTLPEFDAVARDAHARKQMAAASQPLARRSVTWAAASPTVLGGAATVPKSQGFAAIAPQAPTARPVGTPAPMPQQVAGASPALLPQAPPNATPALGVVPGLGGPFPAAAALPRSSRQVPAEDWRDKVFNR